MLLISRDSLRLQSASLVGFFALLCGMLSAADDQLLLTRSLLEVHSADREFPIVEEAMRRRMIEELRWAKGDARAYLTYGKRVDVLLVDLGDAETIEREVSKLLTQRFGSSSVLHSSRQPKIFARLEKVLMEPDGTSKLVGDQEIQPNSTRAAALVVSIAARSSALPASVNHWALNLSKTAPTFSTQMEQVRRFWSENAPQFKAEDYQAVRPPSSVSSVPQANAATNAPVTAPVLPAAARPPAKRAKSTAVTNLTATPPTTPALPPTAAPATPVGTAPLWPWLLLAGASFAGWFWWRSR
jgi:hypothetical protein